jgi:methionine aminotransferase
VDYADVSGENDVSVAKKWTKEIGVASIPLSVFCEQPITGTRLRFCFAKDDETLTTAVEKLSNL